MVGDPRQGRAGICAGMSCGANKEVGDRAKNDTGDKRTSADESLLAAAAAGCAKGLAEALDGGADINTETAEGFTPVILAAKEGHLDCVLLLVSSGACVSQPAARHTAIRAASIGGHTAVIAHLLDNGAHVDAISDGNRTPLMGAAMNGHLAAVQLLLSHGATPHLKNSFGETAADLAKAEDIRCLLRVDATASPA